MRIIKLIVFLSLCIFLGYFFFQFAPPGKSQEEERFVIKIDTPEVEIIDELREKGLLRNKNIFNLILTLKNWHGKIESGAYQVSPNMNAYDLAKTLVSGPYQKWVVIPPGKRKEQVALILKKVLNWPDDMVFSFIRVAEEGYLYPDTYLINVDFDPSQVFQKLLGNFNEKFDAQLQKDLLAQNVRNDTAIKIATLIERESGGIEDKPEIAGIIFNRIARGMKLEIDATVQYAIASQQFAVSSKLASDFDFWPRLGSGIVRTIDSPYNTYLNKGLPPGPICSPSLESIKAVSHPAKTDALYYLHSSDKKIHTAKTLKEHEENITKYLE